MQITQNPNYTNRFDIANISDRKGIRGYKYDSRIQRILGWFLSFFRGTFKFTDDHGKSVYLKRKSAIHFINRLNKSHMMKENAKVSQVIKELGLLFKKSSEKQTIDPNQPIDSLKIPSPVLSEDPFVLKTYVLKEPLAKGLNLRVTCKNKKCKEYNITKWIPRGMGEFNISRDFIRVPCPTCDKWKSNKETIKTYGDGVPIKLSKKTYADTIGLTDCQYKIDIVPATIIFSEVTMIGQTDQGQLAVFEKIPPCGYVNYKISERNPSDIVNTYRIWPKH